MSNPVVSFASQILPLFRQQDLDCMVPQGVLLNNYDYMKVPAHAKKVYGQLSSGNMPPDGAWPQSNIDLFQSWIDGGYQP